MIVRDVGLLAAFWGGFSSFFSIWQACLMQITPFFLAFAVGLYLLESCHVKTPLRSLMLASAGYIIGFSIVFALMGTSGMRVSSYILFNIGDFRTAASIYLAMVALLMVLHNIYSKRSMRVLCLPAGVFLGVSFAIGYSPCIPPVMSEIMNFAGKPANVRKGFSLLMVYGIGLTMAFSLSGAVLSVAVEYLSRKRSVKNIIIRVSSAALFLMAILLITGFMTRYKSFLVGIFVD